MNIISEYGTYVGIYCMSRYWYIYMNAVYIYMNTLYIWIPWHAIYSYIRTIFRYDIHILYIYMNTSYSRHMRVCRSLGLGVLCMYMRVWLRMRGYVCVRVWYDLFMWETWRIYAGIKFSRRSQDSQSGNCLSRPRLHDTSNDCNTYICDPYSNVWHDAFI